MDDAEAAEGLSEKMEVDMDVAEEEEEDEEEGISEEDDEQC
jgi:hypothetical protein